MAPARIHEDATEAKTERRSPAHSSRPHGPVMLNPPGQERVIGVVVPFDFGLDWTYWRFVPPGVELHFTRTPLLRAPVGIPMARAVGRPSAVARATRALMAIDPATVLFACSSGSFVDGVAHDRAVRAAMAAAGAHRPVTTSSAMVDALTATGVRRVAVASPYTGRLTEHLCRFLDEAGFEVVSARHLGLTRNLTHVSQATIAALVRGLDAHDADAVFISCTGLHTYGLVAGLEAEMGRPVFTSDQVSLWRALVAAGALPRPQRGPAPHWTMGGPPPVARSTLGLMDAAATVASWDGIGATCPVQALGPAACGPSPLVPSRAAVVE